MGSDTANMDSNASLMFQSIWNIIAQLAVVSRVP